MPLVAPPLSVKLLAEFALLTSRLGREVIRGKSEPSPESLRGFWQSSRELGRLWMGQLDDWTPANDPGLTQFSQLSAQVFVSEMVVRVWSTTLLGVDRQTGRDDLSRVSRNAVSSLLQVRHAVMSRLLQLPDTESNQVADIERLRRRCDRWTDLLIGNLSGYAELFEFAFDLERARDFATESLEYDPATGPHPVDHLVAAGLRMAFLGQLAEVPLVEQAFTELVQSITAGFPAQALQLDGSFRSLLERRVSAATLRDEPLPQSLFDELTTGETDSASEFPETLPFPGVNFSRLRRRPK